MPNRPRHHDRLRRHAAPESALQSARQHQPRANDAADGICRMCHCTSFGRQTRDMRDHFPLQGKDGRFLARTDLAQRIWPSSANSACLTWDQLERQDLGQNKERWRDSEF